MTMRNIPMDVRMGRTGKERRIGVVDPCPLGRVGLMAVCQDLVNRGAWRSPHVWGFASLQALMEAQQLGGEMAGAARGWDMLILRLPGSPTDALAGLLGLGSPRIRGGVARLVVVTPFSLPETACVLARLPVPAVRGVIGARTPLDALRLTLSDTAGGQVYQCPTPLPLMGQLTERERGVLLHSLLALPVHSLARRNALSSKTLYAQRASALRKLGVSRLRDLFQVLATPGSPAEPGAGLTRLMPASEGASATDGQQQRRRKTGVIHHERTDERS